jgi:hypothetical protein
MKIMLQHSFFSAARGRRSLAKQAMRRLENLFLMANPSFPIQTVHSFVNHEPSFPLNQDMKPSISVPDTGHRWISKTHPKRRLRIRYTFVANRRSSELPGRAPLPLEKLVGCFYHKHQVPLLGGP